MRWGKSFTILSDYAPVIKHLDDVMNRFYDPVDYRARRQNGSRQWIDFPRMCTPYCLEGGITLASVALARAGSLYS
ncbi:unnamed protein product [Dibothriocephalus latus]|uniref:Uncharacterized protein n=1 Tax=Dibothriocephalus latus TaxID=60516 RepID=A0A3P6TTE4_DIBLA|nr:unnamed protein product [Dibothriocephalus latus]